MASRLAQDVLLLAKNHYGPINDRVSLDYLLIVIGENMLMSLDSTLDADGRPASRTTRETLLEGLITTLTDYYGASMAVHFVKEATKKYFIHGRYNDGIASMLGCVSIIAMSEGDRPLFELPELNPTLLAKIEERRQALQAA